jgi:DNA end-binding protein Ku
LGGTVRGFEYEKGSYVVVDDEELKAMRPEATQSVEIRAFVGRDEIDPMLFDTPYYLEPEKKGRRAYALLRDALVKTGKVGIAQVILRTRAHLAALSPNGNGLIVETLHYPHEIVPAKEIDLPPAKEKATAGEMKAAEMLIAAMVERFDPSRYKDDYEVQLRAMLEARARGEAPKRAKTTPAKATNVVDLVEVLKRSLAKRPVKATRHSRAG